MKRDVRLSPEARGDFLRLIDFLAPKNPRAARMAAQAISHALQSLDVHAERGRGAGNLRELSIRFGRDGYVAQYRIDPDSVIVARIFHAREAR